MGTLANSEDSDEMPHNAAFHQGLHCLLRQNHLLGTEIHLNWKMTTCHPIKYIMDHSILIALICMGKFIRIQRVELHGYTGFLRTWPIKFYDSLSYRRNRICSCLIYNIIM